jgi:hypothetical protein
MRSAKLAIIIYICLVICLFLFFIVWYKKDRQVRLLSRPVDHILTETYYAKVAVPGLANSRLQFKKPEPAKYPPNVLVVSPGLFKIVPCRWLAGNPDSLARLGNVVLTEREAGRYFGQVPYSKLMGRTIVYNDTLKAKVAGIIADLKKPDWPESDFVAPGLFTRH